VVQNFSNRWKRIYSASVISELGVELKDRFQIYERVEPLASSAPAFESLS
jgi:hypothetical protein